MKVKELIEALRNMDQNLDVYMFTDHGQQPEATYAPSLIYTNSTGHSLWEDWCEDSSEADEYGYTKQAVLLM